MKRRLRLRLPLNSDTETEIETETKLNLRLRLRLKLKIHQDQSNPETKKRHICEQTIVLVGKMVIHVQECALNKCARIHKSDFC